MPRLLLILPLLLVLLAPDVALAGKKKCKQPHCRFVETYIEPHYGHEWYVDPDGERAFEYEELLNNSENTIFILRYYLTPHFWTVAHGKTRLYLDGFDSQTYRTWPDINKEYYGYRKAKKSGKKYNKKGVMPAQAVDLIYEFKSVDDLPVLRVGVRPLTGNGNATRLSNRYILLSRNEDKTVHESFRPGDWSYVFRAKLPDLSDVKRGEIRYSDWAFCPACVEKVIKQEGVEPFPKLDPNAFFKERGQLPAERFFPFNVDRIWTKKERPDDLVIGEEALQLAATFRQEVIEAEARRVAKKKREEESAELYAEERKTYEAYVAELSRGSLRQAVNKACSKLELRNPPNPRQSGSRLDWYEYGAKQNADNYEKHVRCVLDKMDNFDYSARAGVLADAKLRLPPLFEAGHYEYKSVARFVSARDEVDQLSKYLNKKQTEFRKTQSRYEDAWDEMLDVMAERREKRIRKEVDTCLAGLAMTNSLTSNSGAYCRSMAEQGYTGLSAAVAGMQTGGSSSGSGSSAPAFTQPLVPEFNLSGMIANAQAVADGADASLLFNADGTVRTTIAPEAISHQQRQTRQSPPVTQPRREPVASGSAVIDTDQRLASVTETATQAETPPPTANASGSGNEIRITVNQDIPTPEEMAQLNRGQSPENFSAGWGQAGSAGSTGSATTQTGNSSNGQAGSGGSVSAGTSSTSSTQNTPPKPPKVKKEAKFVWVETELRRKAWPSSTRQRAEKDFRGVLSTNHLNRVCEKAYGGADALNGVMVADIHSLDEAAHLTWNGVVVVGGYCRLLSHDADYDNVRGCITESRGQPDCAVSARH